MQVYNWKRNTAIFLVSQALSLFGSSLVQFAITWYITLTTQSGTYLTLAIVCGFLPTFLLSPFAGVWADRYNRKLLIMLADGGIALATLALAILWMTGNNSIGLLLAALAVRGAGAAIQQPAVGAMLPDMVPTEHLTKINGINGSTISLITLLSPMLSGVMMSLVEQKIISLESIFFIDVLTALLAVGVMLLFFRLPATSLQRKAAPVPAGSSAYFGELKQGLGYIAKHGYLKAMFSYVSIFCFMAAPVAFLTPLQVTLTYGENAWQLAAIEMAFSIGMVVGGLTISAWGGFKNRVHTTGIAMAFMGLTTVCLGLPLVTSAFPVYLIVMGIGGIMMPMFNTPSQVLLQERVDPAYMGRVFSIMVMINTSMMPIGMLVFGPLADRVPIHWLLIITGGVNLLVGLSIRMNRVLLAVGLPQEKQPEPTPVAEA